MKQVKHITRHSFSALQHAASSVAVVFLLAFGLLATTALTPAVAGMDEAKAAASAGDYNLAFKEFKPLAEQGDPYAQYMLALMYLHGKGTGKSQQQGLIWFGKSADQGFADSLFNLGVIYTQAIGVERDYPKGLAYLERAGERGSGDAQFNLGLIHDKGIHVAPDLKQAAQWYQKAAENASVPAQFNLANLYETGQGVAKNELVAYALYDLAARNRFPNALQKARALKARLSAGDLARSEALLADMIKPTKPTLGEQMSGRLLVPRNLTQALRELAGN